MLSSEKEPTSVNLLRQSLTLTIKNLNFLGSHTWSWLSYRASTQNPFPDGRCLQTDQTILILFTCLSSRAIWGSGFILIFFILMSLGMNKSVSFGKTYTPNSNVPTEKPCHALKLFPNALEHYCPIHSLFYNLTTTPQIAFDCSFPLFWPSAKSTGLKHKRKQGIHLVKIMCSLEKDHYNS